MTRYLLPIFAAFVLLPFSAIQTHAQSANLFPTDDAIWRTTSSILTFFADTTGTLHNGTLLIERTYTLEADTFLLGNVWSKLHETNISTFHFNNPDSSLSPTYLPSTYRGGFRNDNERVYFIDASNVEHLYHDYGLAVGDTVGLTYLNPWPLATVVSIDTISMTYGVARRRFAVQSPQFVNGFIYEGIGTPNGLLAPFATTIVAAHTLNCFGENNHAVWPDTATSCGDTTRATGWLPPAASQTLLHVWPNPTAGALHFTCETPRQAIQQWRITDSLGRSIASGNSRANEPQSINLSRFRAGLYILHVDNQTAKVFVN